MDNKEKINKKLIEIAYLNSADAIEEIQKCINAGADINYISKSGRTALDLIIDSNSDNSEMDLDIIYFLIENGAKCTKNALDSIEYLIECRDSMTEKIEIIQDLVNSAM